jgi:type I restriction enzyme S subunit
MARALFKSWFADFDPVRAKAEGRDSGLPKPLTDLFPDSFEDSELGEIPRGWNVRRLGESDSFPLVTPGGFADSTAQMHYIATGDVHRDHITGGTTGAFDSLPSRANMRPGGGRIWFAKMKGSPKYLWTMAEDDEWWSRRVLSTGFAGVQATTREYESILYCFVSGIEFDQYKDGLATGTTMQAVNNDTIARIALVVPPSALAKQFDSLIRPLFRRRWSNAREAGLLAALRDVLLPKLITGELRIEDPARFLGSGD